MLKEKNNTKDLLHFVGKDKIQDFQDSFAAAFGISLCLLSPQGEALTVWSNYPLFCHWIAKENKDRCILEEDKIRLQVLDSKRTLVFNCYMGITVFMVPVLKDNNVIALAYGSGFILEGSSFKQPGKFDITHLSQEQFRKMLELLSSSLNLITEGLVKENTEKDNDSLNSLVFMRKKLSLREVEIVDLINRGNSNKEIADILSISDKTVKPHVTNILRKSA